MRVSLAILLLFIGSATARSSGRPSSSSSASRRSSRSRTTPPPRRRPPPPSDYDILTDDDEYDAYEDEEPVRSSSSNRRPRSSRYDDYDDEDYPPRRTSNTRRPPPRSRREMVTYQHQHHRRPQPSAFTRGLSAIRDKLPDPSTVKESVLTAAQSAQQTTSKLSSNLYREVKGLTSSELEQVMLKATRPDDEPVKSKHVERLVGVTYQISGKYDIYDAVLRKLWNKMAERDVRTKLKSVYVLHRFSVDGGGEHREALKQRLRALRKTRDPKRVGGGKGGKSGCRYFDSKILIGEDVDPETQGYRAFLSRYAHYVLTRAQTFGGIFNEISLAQPPPSATSQSSSKSRKSRSAAADTKPKNPPLCEEHLKFAQMVLKAGLACTLHDGEECESTAMCVERVAADLMGLTSAVATALKRELKSDDENMEEEDASLIRQWCEFYSQELLPETKKFVKKTSSKLDVYGLYLPSRMSASLSQELLERGLKLGGEGDGDVKSKDDGEEETTASAAEEKEEEAVNDESDDGEGDVSLAMSSNKGEDEELAEDEYDEEYYDEYDEEE